MRPQRTRPTAACRLALPALVLALFAWPAPAARADAIDRALYEKAPEIMKYLKDQGYKNVGVLRFQLKKGKGKVTYSGGVINGNMATRLENALLMETDPKDRNPIGIIRGAGAVAAKALGQHWDPASPKDRASLFDPDYPLAWGDKKVKADAFLMGGVKLSEDMRTTTVVITCFDRKSEKDHEVCRPIEVTTDRTILADAGQSYVLSRGLVKKRAAEVDPKTGETKDGKSLDELMNDDAARSAKTRDDSKGSAANEYLEFEVFYGDDAQAVSGDPADGGELRIAAPEVGQAVSFRCKNKTQDTIGLVIFVNGKSTLQYQTDSPDDCRRWVLPADGKDYWVTGYVDENNKKSPIKVVDAGDAAVKNELADKLGLIEVVVFLKGSDQATKASGDLLVSSRGLNLRTPSRTVQKKLKLPQKPKTAAEARGLVFKSMKLKVPDRVRPVALKDRGPGYMVPDPSQATDVDIEEVDLPNPTQVAAPIVIRYNDKPGN